MASQRLKRVVVSVVGVAASAAIATFAWHARGAEVGNTPTPGVCAPINPIVTEAVQFEDKQCRVTAYGFTTGRCDMYLLQGVPVLDCPGVALQKFTMAAWP